MRMSVRVTRVPLICTVSTPQGVTSVRLKMVGDMIKCAFDIPRSLSHKQLTRDTPYVLREGEVYGVPL